MVLAKISDHIQINIRIQNPSQEPPASSKAPNQDLKDIYKTSQEHPVSPNLERKKLDMNVSKTSYPDFGTWKDSAFLRKTNLSQN